MLNKKYQKIEYSDLKGKGKAQESYNFQKASAILADYGFFTNLLKYDWLGADFLAQHLNGDWLKVQLKGRLTIDHRYFMKDLYIMFQHKKTETWYFYPHDDLYLHVTDNYPNTAMAKNGFNTGDLSNWQKEWLENFKV
jgi:hypothetical protein